MQIKHEIGHTFLQEEMDFRNHDFGFQSATMYLSHHYAALKIMGGKGKNKNICVYKR